MKGRWRNGKSSFGTHSTHYRAKHDPLLNLVCTKGFKFSSSQFDIVRMIGSGATASVLLAKHTLTGRHVALKMVPKGGCPENIAREKNVMMHTMTKPSSFVTKTYGTYQDDAFLYFVMEFVSGGELYATMRAQKEFRFSEDVARFYVAEIILAMQDIHRVSGVIHRDMKPENILLGEDGHIKIIDFGFAKILAEDERTYTLCGTADYTAPEMLDDNGYGYSADYWTLGVIFYEMIVGKPPFCTVGPDRNTADYSQIIKGEFVMPSLASDDAQSLIRGLLVLDPTQRLGKSGLDEIKSHSFFKSIDWDAMSAKLVKPPPLARRAKKNVCFISPRSSMWSGSTVETSMFDDFSCVMCPEPCGVSERSTKASLYSNDAGETLVLNGGGSALSPGGNGTLGSKINLPKNNLRKIRAPKLVSKVKRMVFA